MQQEIRISALFILQIQDNEADACAETAVGSLVYGLITDPGSNPMNNVNLNLVPEDGVYLSFMTPLNGKYLFENINPENNYNLSPELKTDYLLGVSTLDLVLIQKHILGIKGFDEAYKFIAADVNRSRSITAADILRIRKTILGESDNFGTTDNAWTFIQNNSDLLQNPNVLLEWEDNLSMVNSDYNKNIDWIGVKFGDINNSNNYSSGTGNLDPRSTEIIQLVSDDYKYSKDENVKVAFNLDKIDAVTGAQFTLNFDTDKLKFESISVDESVMNESDFGLYNSSNGKIVVSWVKPEKITSESMFTINFKGLTDGKLSECIELSDEVARSEAYNLDFEVLDFKLNFRNENNKYSLYQNIPNPFRNETRIYFDMPKTGSAGMDFFDMTGKIVKSISGNYQEGLNYVDVSFDELVNGVIYYRLRSGDYTQTMKMLKIK